MRLFIGIPLEKRAKESIAASCSEFHNIRITAKENLHITLKFLGDCSEDMLSGIKDAVKSCGAGNGPEEIEISGFSAFPDEKRARIIWAVVRDESGIISVIQEKLETKMEEIGFEREKHGFIPHITAGRSKKPVDISRIKGKMGLNIRTDIDRVTLYSSVLRPEGPEYTAVFEKLF